MFTKLRTLIIFLILSQQAFTMKETTIDNQSEPDMQETSEFVEQRDPEVVSFENNVNFILENISYYFPNYSSAFEPFDDSDQNAKKYERTVDFHLQPLFEHMFTLKISKPKDGPKFDLTIKETKNGTMVIKYEENYYQKFQYQLPLYTSFIAESLKWKPRAESLRLKMIGTIMEDLKSSIKRAEFIDNSQEVNFQENPRFNFSIYSGQILLGNLWISMYETDDEKYTKNLDLPKNFILKVELETMKDNKLVNLTEEIAGLNTNYEQYKRQIKSIVNAIDIEGSINVLKEFPAALKEYYKDRIPSMKWDSADPVQQGTLRFLLTHEFSTKYLIISEDVDQYGYKKFKVLIQSSGFGATDSSVEFGRCSKGGLYSILDHAKMNKIFKTIYDDLMDLFEDKFEVLRKELKDQQKGELEKLKNYHVASSYNTWESYGKKNKVIKIDYSRREESKQPVVYLTLEASNFAIKFVRKFKMKTFNRMSLEGLMTIFFQMYRQQA